jgi:signal transduction histidine kinase
MLKFRRMPLRWQLTLLITLISSLTLGVAFISYFILQVRYLKEEIETSAYAAQTQFMKRIIPALKNYQPPPPDTEVEKKSLFGLQDLATNNAIVAAGVFTPDERLLESYTRADAINETIPRPSRYRSTFTMTSDQVFSFKPLETQGRVIGTFYLKAGATPEQRARLLRPLPGMVILFLASVAGSIIISRFLQRGISEPIVKLSEIAHRVARDNDYSVRADIKGGGGETAVMVKAFNSMLTTIQQRDADLVVAKDAAVQAHERLVEINSMLEESNRTLESKVAERTRDLQKATLTAREASQAKSAFLAKMSHELRTPMNAIIGYSEIMLEDATDRGDESAVADLGKILSAARHLLGLINDVLDLSKIEAGKMDLYLESFDVRKLINDVISTAQPLVDRNHNRLTVECPPNIGLIHADATKLRQILLNLLSNASKFTERGEIHLQVVREKHADRETIFLHVRDTGIGMTPAQIGKLFEAFMQADQSTAVKYGGTGLGLAISREIVHRHGGEIALETRSGGGAEARVELPLVPAGTPS